MKTAFRALALGVVILAGVEGSASADGVQPIVPTSQVMYGSAQKTLASNSDVTVDTSTHRVTALKGVRVSTITFLDGSVIASTSIIIAPVWGSISGTLSNQSDLQGKLNTIGTSTAALQTSVTALTASTTTLGTSVANLGSSTGTLAASVASLGASTGTLKTQANAIASDTGTLRTSVTNVGVDTGTLRSFFPVSLSTAVTGTLPVANLVSTVAYTSSSQTFSGQNAWTTPKPSTFTYAVVAGSLTVQDLTASRFVSTDANKKLTSTDLFGGTNTWTAGQTVTSPSGFNSTYAIGAGSLTLTGLPGAGFLKAGGTGIVSTSTINLASDVSGNLSVSNLNSGTNASASTFFRGDGTWISSSTFSTPLSVTTGTSSGFTALVSTGVTIVNFESAQFNAAMKGAATSYVSLNVSSVTLQGNTFNAANKLVRMTSGGQLPGTDANLLTNLNAAELSGIVPAVSLSSAILDQGTLQADAQFHTSSGTVDNTLTVGLVSASTATISSATVVNLRVTGVLSPVSVQTSTLAVTSSATFSGPVSFASASSTITFAGPISTSTVSGSVATAGMAYESQGNGLPPTASFKGLTLNVQKYTSTASTATTNGTFAKTGYLVSVQPHVVGSSVAVRFDCDASVNNNGGNAFFTIERSGTNLGDATTGMKAFSSAVAGTTYMLVGLSTIDAPQSTSALTYEVYFKSTGGTQVTVNVFNAKCELDAWEIGG